MKVLTIGIGIPVGIATKKAVEAVWSTAHPDDPPRKPKDPGVRWTNAITWGVLSAAGVVLSDLVTRRGAEEVWRIVVGTEPPAPKVKTDKRDRHADSEASVVA